MGHGGFKGLARLACQPITGVADPCRHMCGALSPDTHPPSGCGRVSVRRSLLLSSAVLCSALLSRLRVSPSALYSCVCPPAHRAIAPHPPEPPAPSVCPQRPTITNSLRERPRNAFFLSSCADMHLSVLWKIRHAPYRADNPPSARCVADAAGTLSTYALRPRPLICPFFPPLPLFILPSVSDSFTRPLNAFPPPHPSSPLLPHHRPLPCVVHPCKEPENPSKCENENLQK